MKLDVRKLKEPSMYAGLKFLDPLSLHLSVDTWYRSARSYSSHVEVLKVLSCSRIHLSTVLVVTALLLAGQHKVELELELEPELELELELGAELSRSLEHLRFIFCQDTSFFDRTPLFVRTL